MNKRISINILLFLICAGLIFFFYYKSNQHEEIEKITQLNIEAIKEIRITREKYNIVIKKQIHNGISQWQIIEPYNVPAHSFRIKTLLNISQLQSEKSYDIEKLNLVDYGLDKPRANISFDKTTIYYGKTNPINNKRYMLIKNRLHLLNDQTYPLVSAQAAAFVNLQLFPNVEIDAISFDGKALNSLQSKKIITNWQNIKAFSVHPHMLRDTISSITITIDKQKNHFELTQETPWIILSRKDLNIEYHIESQFKTKLFVLNSAEIDDA